MHRIKEFISILKKSRIFTLAGSLAFFSFLAFFPFLLLTLSFAGQLIKKEQSLARLAKILEVLPTTLSDKVIQIVKGMLQSSGVLSIISFLFLLIIVIQMIFELQDSLNRIYSGTSILKLSAKENIKNRIRSISFFLILILNLLLVLIIYGSLVVLSSKIFSHIPVLSSYLIVAIIAFIVETVLFSLSYRLLIWEKTPWKSVIISGLVVSFCLEVLKNVFILYISSMNIYSVLYGSISILFLGLLWLYYSIIVYLSGAAVCRLINKAE